MVDSAALRQTVFFGCLALITAVDGCTDYQDSTYQSYVVQLRGPVQAAYDPSVDPFHLTASYSATVNYYEDAAGMIPYGSSLKTPPAGFQGFSPTVTVRYPGNQTVFPLTANGGSAALPRLSASQTSIYVQSDVYGLDANGNQIAHARCPVQQLQVLSGSLPATVTCQPFFGLIGRWNQIRSPAITRSQFAAVALADGRVVIGGGLDSMTGKPSASVEIFEPNTKDPTAPSQSAGVWAQVGNGAALSAARVGLTATVTTSGYVFFAGGGTPTAGEPVDAGFSGDAGTAPDGGEGADAGTAPGTGLAPVNAVDIYDPSQGAMLPGASPLQKPRAQHAAALLSGDTVFVGAGVTAGNLWLPTFDILAPNTTTSVGPPLSNSERLSPCMVTLPTQQILMCGGASSADAAPTPSCELEDGSSPHPAGNMQLPRGDAKCAVIGSSVYIEGGASPGLTAPQTATIEQWTNGQITVAHSAPALVTQDAAVSIGGLLLQVGGYAHGTTTPLNSGYVYNPLTNKLNILSGAAAMNNPRASFQLVALPDGTAMAIGGLSGSQANPIGAEIFVPN
jgi:hypothetical protein